jgi:hypothetical protein
VLVPLRRGLQEAHAAGVGDERLDAVAPDQQGETPILSALPPV